MSLMKFRENNWVRWVGVRPAHNGEQVAKSGTAKNGITVLYTVPSDSTMFLSLVTLGIRRHTNSTDFSVYIRDTSDVTSYVIWTDYIDVDTCFGLSIPFIIPLEIPAGYDICLSTGADYCNIYAFIHGWVE